MTARARPRPGTTTDRFATGRLIVHRNVRHDCVGWIRPVRVVADDERGLLLWLAGGTTIGFEVAAAGGNLRTMPLDDWLSCEHAMATGTWDSTGTLMFLPPGAAHSVWWMRDDAGQFAGWYVNLEEAAVRWHDPDLAGVDIVDQDLDIVISPDRVPEWKDEEEFAERLAFGEKYWVRDEQAVRAEGERVIDTARRGEFPFDGSWCDFTPPAEWATPSSLPDGCLRPPQR